MEITEVVKKGEMKSGGATARFTLACKDEGTPKEILGYIYNGLDMAGSFNARPDGTFGISLQADNGLSKDDFRDLLSQIVDMADEVFNGNVKTE